jgi:hypothetical protein
MTDNEENELELVIPADVAKEGGEGGEAGYVQISNSDFISAVFGALRTGAYVAVSSKPGNPLKGGWVARRFVSGDPKLETPANHFVGCSALSVGADGSFKARKANFASCHFLMLDDLGTKVPLERLDGFELSWLIETSPGNFQGGIIFSDPLTDGQQADRLLNAIIDAGLCDSGAKGAMSRWARLPNGINGKPKYLCPQTGQPFKCKLHQWQPEKRYTPDEVVAALNLQFPHIAHVSQVRTKAAGRSSATPIAEGDVFIPKADENPVIEALKARGLYKTPLGSGRHDVTCPWVHEHTDGVDTGAAYFEPDEHYPLGGYCCQHSHGDKFHIKQLLEYLDISKTNALHKAVIRVIAGDLHRVVDAAEKELAVRGRHYQAGGLIVSVATDPITGDPSIVPATLQALTRELSVAATWEKWDGRTKSWVPCDPPARHTSILFDAQSFRSLPPLAGVVRQPYFRENDGVLVRQPGYDPQSQLFGVFDARQFVLKGPTLEAAQQSLVMVEELLAEFHFVTPADKAAALSAIFTAVVRPTLPHAPAFHVRAPIFGSGKTYLCELIGSFAGPGGNQKVSYPMTSEEATKVILSLLLTSPAVVEFDDMDTDWIPHGTIKRMLTAENITDRILGVSKTATVSTRTLFLGSGNNVGPIRDLLRRVLTIHVDPRCPTPATNVYAGRPVEKVRRRRADYVSAILTIIEAWKAAGQPVDDAKNIVTYDGAWSHYCRYPLMWLGHPDPATSLFEQISRDPDSDILGALMQEWHLEFGSMPTTVRRVVDRTFTSSNLLDAIREFPVEERGEINRSKLGWILKKNANRIVNGFEFQQSEADGRVAWRVVRV